MKKFSPYLISILSLTLTAACSDDDVNTTPDGGVVDADAALTPDAETPSASNSYVFESRFETGVSPVSKSGQAFRQILISELKSYMSGLTATIDATPPNAGETKAALEFYLDFDSTTSGTIPLTITATPATMQTAFNDVSSNKNLVGKVAGNDTVTDHKDWSTEFVGWPGGNGDSPEALLRAWVQKVDDMAVARVATPELAPNGTVISEVYTTAQGQNLLQLIQKLLLVSIGMSQGMDDYLDDDVEGKGLLSSNMQDGDTAHTGLGKAWDEAFGYFGASIDYDQYTDDERASKGGRDDYQGHHDLDANGAIDLVSEFNFGNSVNCGKRDRGSDTAAKTTFGDDAFTAFRDGRALILSVDGELSPTQLDQLRAFRDTARNNWEKCVAATVIHYINEVEKDMEDFDSDTYNFETHAKHWSELKGFALGFQFNPASPMNSQSRFLELHGILGIAPVLATAPAKDISDYKAGLTRIKMVMKAAYGFDDLNLAGW